MINVKQYHAILKINDGKTEPGNFFGHEMVGIINFITLIMVIYKHIETFN